MQMENIVRYILLSSLIGIILIISVNLYNNTNKNEINLETFYDTTTTIPTTTILTTTNPTTTNPTTTNPLVPLLKTSNENLNKVRFTWIDNQQKLDDITARINNAKLNLVNLSKKPSYSASGELVFY